jgi:tetratricopeptide (TPR) repeat protein
MATQDFSRAEVRRILKIQEQSLRSWERHGLCEQQGRFAFPDLGALRTIKRLREHDIPSDRIRASLLALRNRIGVRRPLSELRLTPRGRFIAVDLPNVRMEALTGQLLLDFGAPESNKAAVVERPEAPVPSRRVEEAEGWFQRGLEIEERGGPPAEAAEAYTRSVELNPRAAGAWVNLGTLRYREGDLKEAERLYRKALGVSTDYALAHFNLGNVCEETARLEEAREQYEEALRLNSSYADAHYNLALVYERRHEPMRAVMHWRAYLKLDPASPWAGIARRQLKGLLQITPGGASRQPPLKR